MEREFGWLLDPVTRGDYPEALKVMPVDGWRDQRSVMSSRSMGFIAAVVNNVHDVYVMCM